MMVGDAGVGKTWLCHRIMKHDHYFSLKEYVPTIEEEFTKNVSVNDHNVSVHIMDTSGQDQFEPLRYLFLYMIISKFPAAVEFLGRKNQYPKLHNNCFPFHKKKTLIFTRGRQLFCNFKKTIFSKN
jgi:hypothetical protein